MATGAAGVPTGTIHLAVDDDSYGVLIPLAGGAATFGIPDTALGIPDPLQTDLGIGLHTIGVDYSGDSVYASQPPIANRVPLTVLQASSVTVSVSANPASYGQPVTYTAIVTQGFIPGTEAITAVPAAVNFFDNGIQINATALTLVGNQAQFTPPVPVSVGTHVITATFLGDSRTAGSTSSPVNVIVNVSGTVTSLAAPANNGTSFFGQAISFSAGVAAQAPGAGIATGSVQFLDGNTVIASGGLTSGRAGATLANLPAGTHSFTAQAEPLRISNVTSNGLGTANLESVTAPFSATCPTSR